MLKVAVGGLLVVVVSGTWPAARIRPVASSSCAMAHGSQVATLGLSARNNKLLSMAAVVVVNVVAVGDKSTWLLLGTRRTSKKELASAAVPSVPRRSREAELCTRSVRTAITRSASTRRGSSPGWKEEHLQANPLCKATCDVKYVFLQARSRT